MRAEFKKIYEHDMDLIILEEFVADRGFARLFLNKVGLSDDYVLDRAAHSLSDEKGESDITLVLRYGDKKVAVLIEDKIDAPTMERQSARYDERAEEAKKRGEYDEHFVILAAPEAYHREHWEDANAAYKHRINYEEMAEWFRERNDPRSEFKADMIEFALREKKAGYLVREVDSVTGFWKELRQYCKSRHSGLVMVGEDAPKGYSARWPEFRTSLRGVKVVYKSQKGQVDLEFPRYADRTGELNRMIGANRTDDMKIHPAGKSAVLRMEREHWVTDFTRPFEEEVAAVEEVLQAVSALCSVADQLNYTDLYE